MNIVWTEFANAGLAKNVPVQKQRAIKDWIEHRLRTEPWQHGREAPVGNGVRVDAVFAGVRIRFLYAFDEQDVRVLSISRDT